MKKTISIFMVMAVLVVALGSPALAAEKEGYLPEGCLLLEDVPKIYLNDNRLDIHPIAITDDRILVPCLAFCGVLGAQEVYRYDDGLRVMVSFPRKVFIFNLGSKEVDVSGEWVDSTEASWPVMETREMDSYTVRLGGYILVPLRFVAENLGYEVDWDDATRSVYIEKEATS